VLGLAWIALALSALPWLGLSLRDDVLERRNPAAAWAVAGAAVGTTLLYGLANTGDGPGWWCVVVAALLAQAALFLGWAAMLALSDLHDAITIDRDPGAGLRAGAWFAAAGLVLGRAAAGSWTSFDATVLEFVDVARHFPLLIAAGVMVEIFVRKLNGPHPDHHPLLTGGLGCAIHFALAAWIFLRVGPWQ
jgi:hypothetical protein